MLNCPFCGSDYSEVGLQQGRCRSCGSVIAWEEEGVNDELQQSAAAIDAPDGVGADPPSTTPVAPETPSAPDTPSARQAADPEPDATEASPVPPGRETTAERPAAGGDEAPVERAEESKSKDPLSSSQKKQLDAVWGATIQPAMGALMTIRGTNAPGCSDTKLVIQTRALRDLPDRTRQLPLQERAGLRVAGGHWRRRHGDCLRGPASFD